MPGLATSWEFTGPDKLTFRLHLRHGVTFQDGTPFNAEAVKVSLDHYKSASTNARASPNGCSVPQPQAADRRDFSQKEEVAN